MKVLRDSDELLLPQVQHTISQLELRPEDSAAATLAERYAAAIDGRGCAECASKQGVLAELGPKLLACLVELGATPKARAVKGGGSGAGGKLANLRAARTAG